jgi:hypothetical protein
MRPQITNAADANLALMKQLGKEVAVRRITYSYDLLTKLPCASPPTDKQDPTFAMPACSGPDMLVNTGNPDGTLYWRE